MSPSPVEKTETVSWATIERFVRRLEREALRRYGRSLSAGTLLSRVTPYIVEERLGERKVVVRAGWKNALRDAQNEYLRNEEVQ